ncbi:CaiB/BaiF CoA transferase family protein [Hydrogenophaga sp. BPS33]|uniref:CaiB/BaiF CoA transferase family protein n=1 Tax=Hydrogenophaga sp. BPS33 TaxID=2651974 RepID=UPI00131F956B|nr:CaiB/BaiF CoA-transferase family protein [Hydrogenophaga sp. BPS33]QHE84839.1 CoA transferase [Hydrogenophaga sp. BPS33]
MASPPLAGVRVLSLAEQYPGPYATLLLADLGADVILVERPESGDPTRRHPGLFASLGRNKRSIALDLKSPSERARFLELVDTADVVMEGFRPGVMGRLGLDSKALRARKPSLIYVSISSFGQTGPMAAVAGHDLSIQAVAGMVSVPSGREETATLPVLPLADIASGMFAALSVATALVGRNKNGDGCSVDVSMLDAMVSWMTPFLVPGMNQLPVRPLPPEDPGYGVFATANGGQLTLSIAGEDHMWAALCGILELNELAVLGDAVRSERRAEIVPRLRDAIRTRTLDALCEQLTTAGIAFAPVQRGDGVLNHPQVQARGLVVEHEGQRHIRQPVLFDGQGSGLSRGVPALGEHTREILDELGTAARGVRGSPAQ